MLKGSTKIQLFDGDTGKETYSTEKHNEVTKAVEKTWQIVNMGVGVLGNRSGSVRNLNSYPDTDTILHNPEAMYMMGGLILFDRTVPSGSLFAPAENEPVGYGGYDTINTIGSQMLGNYNATESSIDLEKKKVTFVWDFPTNVANGEINSICLTNIGTGLGKFYGIDVPDYFPDTYQYLNTSGMTNNVGKNDGNRKVNNDITVCVDTENHIFYTVRIVRNTTDSDLTKSNTIAIRKWKFSHVFNTVFNHMKGQNFKRSAPPSHYYEKDIMLDGIDIVTDPSNGNANFCIFSYGTTLYITGTTTNEGFVKGMTVKLAKINMSADDPHAEYVTVKCPDAYTLRFNTLSNYGRKIKGSSNYALCTDGKYVYAGTDEGFIIRMSMTNISDSSAVTEAIVPSDLDKYQYNNYDYLYYLDGRIFANSVIHNRSREYIINPVTGRYKRVNNLNHDFDNVPVVNGLVDDVADDARITGWLATINNLEDPIKKTPSSTMKITYTISEG